MTERSTHAVLLEILTESHRMKASDAGAAITPTIAALCRVIDAKLANLRDELTPPQPVKLESTSDPRFDAE